MEINIREGFWAQGSWELRIEGIFHWVQRLCNRPGFRPATSTDSRLAVKQFEGLQPPVECSSLTSYVDFDFHQMPDGGEV